MTTSRKRTATGRSWASGDATPHVPRHRAPRTRTRTAAVALVALLATSGATTFAQGAFTDTGTARAAVSAYKVPTAVPATVEGEGTGQWIKTRLMVSCEPPAEMTWRWHDQMVGWDYWNPWSAWSATVSDKGWTGWSTSRLDFVGQPAAVQWEVRCGITTWTSTAVLSPASQIIRTS